MLHCGELDLKQFLWNMRMKKQQTKILKQPVRAGWDIWNIFSYYLKRRKHSTLSLFLCSGFMWKNNLCILHKLFLSPLDLKVRQLKLWQLVCRADFHKSEGGQQHVIWRKQCIQSITSTWDIIIMAAPFLVGSFMKQLLIFQC